MILGRVDTVTPQTPLVRVDDAQRIIAGVDAALRPCGETGSAILVAELLASKPELAFDKAGRSAKDMAAYTAKLAEAFRQYPYGIGKAAVHGGTGIPVTLVYRPEPVDIHKFCKAELEKFHATKTMAMRHLAEHRRRAEGDEREAMVAADRARMTPDERAQKVAAAIGAMKSVPVVPVPRITSDTAWKPSAALIADLERRKQERLAMESEFPTAKATA